MKKYWIEKCSDWKESPMAFWVHKNLDGNWQNSSIYDPPAPKQVEGKKYNKLMVEIFGIQLEFTSKEQYFVFIDTLEQKNMPATIKLSNERNGYNGPNNHWLSRLPSEIKSYKKRSEIIAYLKTIEVAKIWLTTASS